MIGRFGKQRNVEEEETRVQREEENPHELCLRNTDANLQECVGNMQTAMKVKIQQ